MMMQWMTPTTVLLLDYLYHRFFIDIDLILLFTLIPPYLYQFVLMAWKSSMAGEMLAPR